jgi:hypothetical protein
MDSILLDTKQPDLSESCCQVVSLVHGGFVSGLKPRLEIMHARDFSLDATISPPPIFELPRYACIWFIVFSFTFLLETLSPPPSSWPICELNDVKLQSIFSLLADLGLERSSKLRQPLTKTFELHDPHTHSARKREDKTARC